MGTQFELYKESEENSIFVTDKSALYDDSQMGDNLSDFEVLRELGSFNGHNTISKVRSLKNGKIYAMKHIELKRIGNEQEKDLCNKGMEKLIALKHPHLLSYYKTFKNNDDLYLIYEYMDNDDLNSFIKGYQTLDEKVDEEIIWNYLLQCLSGLSYLHINNLAYLAIKPTNIFLNNEQKLKIGLFYDTPKLTDKYYNIKDDIRFIGLYFYKMCFSQYVKNSKWIDDFNINKNIQNKFYSKNLIDIIFLMLEEDVNKRMSSKELYSIVKDIYVKNFTNNTSIEALLRCLNSFPAFTNEILQLEKKFTEDQKKYLISYWFTKTLSGLNSGGDLNVFLEKFRNVLASENSKLDGSKEVNPIYLLAFLFEKMHNEGNEKKKTEIKNDLENQYIINCKYNVEEEDKSNREQIFNNFYSYYNSNVNSIISRYFFGILKSKRNCRVCKTGLYSFSNVFFIPFNLKELNKNYFDLINDGFRGYYYNDSIDLTKNDYHIYCERCLTEQDYCLFNRFHSLNSHLIIYFYRGRNYEINVNINFPQQNPEILDIKQFIGPEMTSNYYLVGSLNRIIYNNKEKFIYFSRDSKNSTYWHTSLGDCQSSLAPLNLIQSNGQIVMLFYNKVNN